MVLDPNLLVKSVKHTRSNADFHSYFYYLLQIAYLSFLSFVKNSLNETSGKVNKVKIRTVLNWLFLLIPESFCWIVLAGSVYPYTVCSFWNAEDNLSTGFICYNFVSYGGCVHCI